MGAVSSHMVIASLDIEITFDPKYVNINEFFHCILFWHFSLFHGKRRSERVSKTGVTGTLLSEAKYINVSLHFLEQVGGITFAK